MPVQVKYVRKDLCCGVSWYVDAFGGFPIICVNGHIPEKINVKIISIILLTLPSPLNKTQLQEVPKKRANLSILSQKRLKRLTWVECQVADTWILPAPPPELIAQSK